MEKSADLASGTQATGVRIIRSAARNWENADARSDNLVLRGRGGLGGGHCSGEDEDDDKGADEMFHSEIPPKLYCLKKISLNKPDEVTIGYKME